MPASVASAFKPTELSLKKALQAARNMSCLRFSAKPPQFLNMGNLKKKRRLKMNNHKRRKRLKSNRHKKRTW
jgi:hypothetical protein